MIVMSERISENHLFLPALYVIYLNNEADTSLIKEILVETLHPSGEDNELLAGRKDTKFTQKVRNLMGSHYQANGMAQYTTKDAMGCFSLTEQGVKVVEDNIGFLEYLFESGFKYEESKEFASKVYAVQGKKRKLYVYSENDVVLEGKANIKTSKTKERSKMLREAAVKYYTVDDRIKCCACGFDFTEKYGEHGAGYIQIHHEKPIYQYSDEGFSTYIKEAILNTKPLCANCHCMIHRNKTHMLEIEELKEIIEQTSQF